MDKTKKKDRFRTIRIIKNILFGIVIVFLSVVLILTMYSRLSGKTPSLFGYSLFRVSSGSMKPELDIGDVILVQKCDGNTVKKNEVISYNATSGVMAGKLVTHRVVEAPYQDGDKAYLVTKGDANNSNDEPISVNQVEGKLVFKIPILKQLFDFFATPWGLLALIALIILAFFNEIVIFVKSIFGIGYEPEESVDDIIERYQREQLNQNRSEQSDSSDNAE